MKFSLITCALSLTLLASCNGGSSSVQSQGSQSSLETSTFGDPADNNGLSVGLAKTAKDFKTKYEVSLRYLLKDVDTSELEQFRNYTIMQSPYDTESNTYSSNNPIPDYGCKIRFQKETHVIFKDEYVYAVEVLFDGQLLEGSDSRCNERDIKSSASVKKYLKPDENKIKDIILKSEMSYYQDDAGSESNYPGVIQFNLRKDSLQLISGGTKYNYRLNHKPVNLSELYAEKGDEEIFVTKELDIKPEHLNIIVSEVDSTQDFFAGDTTYWSTTEWSRIESNQKTLEQVLQGLL